MKTAYVGVTDNGWASFLADRPHLDEVNFWLPSPSATFKRIGYGDPFLFKTHAPHNRLVGGGFLTEYRVLTVSEAWRFFGEGNGVASEAALREAIVRFRSRSERPVAPGEDPFIGCTLLDGVFFVAEALTLAAPPDFAGNIVRGKGYPLEAGSYVEQALWSLLEHSSGVRLPDAGTGLPTVIPGPMFRDHRQLVDARAGQQAFRAAVTAAYHRRCAITGSRLLPTLEAAHIRPVAADGQNWVNNGLLLKSDAHKLYDLGYLGVGPDHRLHVSPALRRDTGNGDEFYRRAGESLVSLPDNEADRPNREALEWHMDSVFRAA
ncbi:HNH endonuclease [Antribacter gilvus]|uniref:HNH endonuclease n=1 Tax=Antribacter gilvus TaxID=2304675 RepID=UPI000F77FF3B|nr:HNH endonuclease [Antribacter gilvus]